MPWVSLEQRLDQLDAEMGDLVARLGGLPRADEAGDIWHAIWLDEAHHSTALEGNSLVLRQVEELLAEGRAVGGKELREYLEVQGYAKASQWVYERRSTSETMPRSS
jgi:Fic family protein